MSDGRDGDVENEVFTGGDLARGRSVEAVMQKRVLK